MRFHRAAVIRSRADDAVLGETPVGCNLVQSRVADFDELGFDGDLFD